MLVRHTFTASSHNGDLSMEVRDFAQLEVVLLASKIVCGTAKVLREGVSDGLHLCSDVIDMCLLLVISIV